MTTDEQDRLVRKAVRARSLVDPLGAMGYRTTRTRVDREARWRRAAFAATGACFFGIMGSMLIGLEPRDSLADQLLTDQRSSQVVGSASGLPQTSTAPSALIASGGYYDDDDHDAGDGDHDNNDAPVRSIQLPAQDSIVTVSQPQVQSNHGRTEGS